MIRLLLLSALLAFSLTGCTTGPLLSSNVPPGPHPMYLSSLGGTFPVQIALEGTYEVKLDSIEVRIQSGELRVTEYQTYNGRRQITGIKLGLATGTKGDQWTSLNTMSLGRIDQTVAAGMRATLAPTTVRIPIATSLDLSKHWFLAEIDSIPIDRPEGQRRAGMAYAHSARDIFESLGRR